MPTKMATAAVLAGAGDVIAQRIEASGPFAIRRFLTLIAVNVLCTQPRPALALDTLSRALPKPAAPMHHSQRPLCAALTQTLMQP